MKEDGLDVMDPVIKNMYGLNKLKISFLMKKEHQLNISIGILELI